MACLAGHRRVRQLAHSTAQACDYPIKDRGDHAHERRAGAPLRLNRSSTGRLAVPALADPGTVTYRFAGHRATGTMVISPRFADAAEPLPSRVLVHLGAGARGVPERHRHDLPTINGVTLSGPLWLDFDEYLAQERPRLCFHRASGQPTPRATNQYATAILTAILAAWRDRPQRPGELRNPRPSQRRRPAGGAPA